MSNLYKRIELKEGEPVQYVGVYILKWKVEMGEPEVGFVQDDETEEKLDRAANLFQSILDTINKVDVVIPTNPWGCDTREIEAWLKQYKENK